MMMSRRWLLLSAPAACLASAAGSRAAGTVEVPGVPPTKELVFDAFRKGSRIGQHILRFDPVGGDMQIRIDVQFTVGFGPITLYRYRMTGIERWKAGAFDSIATETNDDGEKRRLSAHRTAAGVQLSGAQSGDRLLAADCLPLTHWAIRQMQSPLFNPETGADMGRFASSGPAHVPLASGRTIAADAFNLTKPSPITDWYDTASVWSGLRATAKDGSIVEYRRA